MQTNLIQFDQDKLEDVNHSLMLDVENTGLDSIIVNFNSAGN